jgi:drug/metabolite transporter (DMT)-like permease
VFVALFSFLMLGEQIITRQITGIVLVFIGVWITVRPDGKTEERLIKDAD